MARVIIVCPSCSQKLRVPNDKGDILVTCANCSLKWMWEPKVKATATETAPIAPEEKTGVLSWFAKTKQGLTGGAADVYLSPLARSVKPGESIEFKIDVHVSEFELKAKEVLLEVIGEEMVVLPWNSVRIAMGSKFDALREAGNLVFGGGKFSHQETTFKNEYRVVGKIAWDANAKGEFKVSIEIPSNAVPTFQGQTIASQWRARAVVNSSGVSPKSEWMVVNVVNS